MIDFILQTQWRNQTISKLGTENMVTLYSHQEELLSEKQKRIITLYCALIPNHLKEEVLADSGWDRSIGMDLPGSVSEYTEGEQKDFYQHFTQVNQTQPLVLVRHFPAQESYIEILEEFRLFHDLYYKRQEDREIYTKFFNDGTEEEIIRIKDKKVEIRLKEIKQFLSWKQMCLALYYVVDCFSNMEISEVQEDARREERQDAYIHYSFVLDSSFDGGVLSRLLGKKLIYGTSPKEGEIWPPEDEKKFENFIIGVDTDGKDIERSCDPENLSGRSYLQEVFFRKDILARYYAESNKYQITDSYIRMSGFWGMKIDNNHPNYIVAYLGDLADLPYTEQKVWRSYNVVPDGNISDVHARRTLLAEFAEPTEAALKFKSRFEDFQQAWYKKTGWYLFKPLSVGDKHHWDALHIPLSEGYSEFDNQILSLTKTIVDSLNEEEIVKLIRSKIPENTKGIKKFEMYLNQENVIQFNTIIDFLHQLYSIRSMSAAHRKRSGLDIEIRKRGIDPSKLKEGFTLLIEQATESLNILAKHFLNDSDTGLNPI